MNKKEREAFQKDKKNNPFGLYHDRNDRWTVDVPSKIAFILEEEYKSRYKARLDGYGSVGTMMSMVLPAEGFTELLNALKEKGVKGQYCKNDPYFTWANI